MVPGGDSTPTPAGVVEPNLWLEGTRGGGFGTTWAGGGIPFPTACCVPGADSITMPVGELDATFEEGKLSIP